MADETTATDALELATDLTIAWLANPNTRASADDVAAMLAKMHTAVAGLLPSQTPAAPETLVEEFVPAVTVRRSLASRDHITSLIDGKPYKALKRHLSGQGLTPDEYRARYSLKPDYLMVSEAYSEVRRAMARKIGLGRKPGQKAAAKGRKIPKS